MINERKEKMKEMYSQGMTFDAIGKSFGISKQRVYQLIGCEKPHHTVVTEKQCIYPVIRNYMNLNGISIAKLTKMMYGNVHSTHRSRVTSILRGENVTKSNIDTFLKATGLTYEDAFKRSDNNA